jgi:predicted dehydrogenase
MVLIATPPHLHCEQTVRALDLDIHVLCEKPMSGRLEDAIRMKQASERSGAILSIGFNLHFDPGIRRLRHLIQDGRVGTVLQAHYKVGTYVTLTNSRSRYQSELEGALLLDYTHQPDIIFWILHRKPSGVYMAAGKGGDMEFSSNPNFLTIVCDYDVPLITTIDLNYLQMPQRHECEIIGDEGWALLDFERKTLRIGNKSTNCEIEEALESTRDVMYQLEHQAFLDAVAGRREPSSPPEEAIVSMEIIQAALISWKRQQRVPLTQTAD